MSYCNVFLIKKKLNERCRFFSTDSLCKHISAKYFKCETLFFFHRKGFSLNFVFSLVCVDIILGEFYAVELLLRPVTSAYTMSLI